MYSCWICRQPALGVSTNGQNLGVLNLSLLDSGVGSTGGLGAGTGPSVGGQRPRNNNFTVEGIDNNNKGITGPLIYIPAGRGCQFLDSAKPVQLGIRPLLGWPVQSHRAERHQHFHGKAVRVFPEPQSERGRPVVLATPGHTSPTRASTATASADRFGGPIFKNKLFFFANYEYNPVGQAASPGSPLLAPTSSGYDQLVGDCRVLSQQHRRMQQYAVAPSACSAADVAIRSGPAGTLPVNGACRDRHSCLSAPNYQNLQCADDVDGLGTSATGSEFAAATCTTSGSQIDTGRSA